MTQHRRPGTAAVLLSIVLALAPVIAQSRPGLPARLTDADFWALSLQLSEPNGAFRSDNLMSNESGLQRPIPELLEKIGAGGIYLGVGPEQNFTYIANLKPRFAFILDVRRGNRDLHLMYKAIFELSKDRADFVSMLFSLKRPDGLSTTSTVGEIFAAFEPVTPVESDYDANLAKIKDTLLKAHQLPLSADEWAGIEYVYRNFYTYGPGLNYSSSTSGRRGVGSGSYAGLMQIADGQNNQLGYLASEANYQVVKDLEAKNLIVPVVGNFAGPTALRAVGAWLKERSAVVSAYYLSNVEQYLVQDNLWMDFCRNVATLPLDEKSQFIRSGAALRPLPPHVQILPTPTPTFSPSTPPPTVPPTPPTPPPTSPPPTTVPPTPPVAVSTFTFSPDRLISTQIRYVAVSGLSANRLGQIVDEIKACAVK